MSKEEVKQKKFSFTTFNMDSLRNYEMVKQGAEAKLYKGLFDADKSVIVKERFKKSYRQPDLDKSLTAKRIKNEVKMLNKAQSLAINVPKVYLGDLNNGVIVMEYVENSITCKEFIFNLVKSELSDEAKKKVLADLSMQIGRVIGKLQLHEIIHGDLTTSNILIVQPEEKKFCDDVKIYFIDFGLSFVSGQLEDKAVDLYVLERALLSTHSVQAEFIFENIMKGFEESYGKNAHKVIERFEQVRLRGRKRSMIG